MQIQDIRQRLRALAARPVHEDRILRAWLQARALDQRTRRQSVLLPRGGVSTQVGCTVGRMINAPNCSPRQQVAPTQRS